MVYFFKCFFSLFWYLLNLLLSILELSAFKLMTIALLYLFVLFALLPWTTSQWCIIQSPGLSFGEIRPINPLRLSILVRKDNAYLLGMLKKTKEYENFGNFAEDSGGNAIRIPANKEN